MLARSRLTAGCRASWEVSCLLGSIHTRTRWRSRSLTRSGYRLRLPRSRTPGQGSSGSPLCWPSTLGPTGHLWLSRRRASARFGLAPDFPPRQTCEPSRKYRYPQRPILNDPTAYFQRTACGLLGRPHTPRPRESWEVVAGTWGVARTQRGRRILATVTHRLGIYNRGPQAGESALKEESSGP
jgi:hypothetical protein